MRHLLKTLTVVALLGGTGHVTAQQTKVPAGYDASYASIIEAAKREGSVTIYGAWDAAAMGALLDDFRAVYPEVKVDFVDSTTNEVYNRAVSEAAAGQGTADLLVSLPDLQIKLANDGYAQAYTSPEKPNIEPWAVWKDEAYAFTVEPLAIIYNKRLVPDGDVPRTREQLVELLASQLDKYKGKLITIDPEKIGSGLLYWTQETEISPKTWDMIRAFGKADLKLYTSTGAQLERVGSGESLLGYQIVGSYALNAAKKNPSLGVVIPEDYVMAVSRVMLIPKNAPHPNAAKLFVDYMLSKRGQELSAKRMFGTVRTDMSDVVSAIPSDLKDKVRPIRIGPESLTYLDQSKRMNFLRDWQKALKGN